MISRFWRRVAAHVCVPPESLGLFRWIFGLSFLAILAPHSAWIHSVPEALFLPQVASFANLFSAFPPKPTFLVLDAVTLISLASITIGYRTRPASVVFILTNIIASNFKFSFGKIDRDFLPTAFIACMLLTDWGAYYSLDARRRGPDGQTPERTSRGMAMLAVLVAFGMFSSGLPKVVKWVDFDLTTNGFLSWLLPNYFSIGRSFLLAPWALRMPPLVAEMADYSAALFELSGFPALLYSRGTWLIFLISATAFHLATSLTLNIPFHDHVIVYLAFVDWTRVCAPFLKLWQRFQYGTYMLYTLLASLVVWHLVSRAGGQGSSVAFLSSTVDADIFDLYVSVPICVVALGLLTDSLLISQRPSLRRAGHDTDRRSPTVGAEPSVR